MGVYKRNDSHYYWLWLETIKARERTTVPIGETTSQKKDNKAVAVEVYHQRMRETAAHVHRLPVERPALRFAPYAETYATDVIAHRRGARRELEMLQPLRRFFDRLLLTQIDTEAARAYMTARTAASIQPRTVNREVDLLKGMIRDAAPKYLERSPLVGLKRLRVAPLKRRLLAPVEEQRLLAVCEDAQDTAILMLGIDTMTRLGDLLDLARTDRDGAWLYIKDSKSGEAYNCALSPRCQAALDAIDPDRPYYFAKFRRAEDPHNWPGSVRQRLEYLCRKAKLPYGRTKGGITFHWATRRTGATRFLIDQQAPLAIVQKQGNWKHPELLLQIYTEARQDDQLRMVGARPARRRKA
jgi:Phage integrase family